MLGDPIRTKAQMYAGLIRGDFGNTPEQFLSLQAWEASAAAQHYRFWGVRSQVVGGPCRLYCPAEEVRETVARFACPVNISIMVDAIATVTLWADIYDSPTGLSVYGIEYPPHRGSWRALMPSQGRTWDGLAARLLLRKHLNPNSLADLEIVFERWPGHVVELSALERCFGEVPHRNAVLWEVRDY